MKNSDTLPLSPSPSPSQLTSSLLHSYTTHPPSSNKLSLLQTISSSICSNFTTPQSLTTSLTSLASTTARTKTLLSIITDLQSLSPSHPIIPNVISASYGKKLVARTSEFLSLPPSSQNLNSLNIFLNAVYQCLIEDLLHPPPSTTITGCIMSSMEITSDNVFSFSPLSQIKLLNSTLGRLYHTASPHSTDPHSSLIRSFLMRDLASISTPDVVKLCEISISSSSLITTKTTTTTSSSLEFPFHAMYCDFLIFVVGWESYYVIHTHDDDNITVLALTMYQEALDRLASIQGNFVSKTNFLATRVASLDDTTELASKYKSDLIDLIDL
ncbi:hypothetical protein ScalyP_jg12102 [Parmales sp. scaly parma]|nr:hypothetical protein ScalyP_jg12102 [Parmales sp. scaly parma]